MYLCLIPQTVYYMTSTCEKLGWYKFIPGPRNNTYAKALVRQQALPRVLISEPWIWYNWATLQIYFVSLCYVLTCRPNKWCVCMWLVCPDVVPDSLVLSVNTRIPVIARHVWTEQLARARSLMVFHSIPVCAKGVSEVHYIYQNLLSLDKSYQRREIKSSYFNGIYSLFNLKAKTALSSMPVPQVPVPMGLAVPTGITTTTVPAHLASRERTAAVTLMSAASLACASMVASALTLMGPTVASAHLDTAGAHVRCPPCRVPHHSVLMGVPVVRPANIPTSALASQVK